MNGILWKKDSIECFNTIFKPLFLCFQERGNGTKDHKPLIVLLQENYHRWITFVTKKIYIYNIKNENFWKKKKKKKKYKKK